MILAGITPADASYRPEEVTDKRAAAALEISENVGHDALNAVARKP
jgi:hypothetical protein